MQITEKHRRKILCSIMININLFFVYSNLHKLWCLCIYDIYVSIYVSIIEQVMVQSSYQLSKFRKFMVKTAIGRHLKDCSIKWTMLLVNKGTHEHMSTSNRVHSGHRKQGRYLNIEMQIPGLESTWLGNQGMEYKNESLRVFDL